MMTRFQVLSSRFVGVVVVVVVVGVVGCHVLNFALNLAVVDCKVDTSLCLLLLLEFSADATLGIEEATWKEDMLVRDETA